MLQGVRETKCIHFGGTYNKIGTIQRRLAWPLRKDDTQIREAFHIFGNFRKNFDFFFEKFNHRDINSYISVRSTQSNNYLFNFDPLVHNGRYTATIVQRSRTKS